MLLLLHCSAAWPHWFPCILLSVTLVVFVLLPFTYPLPAFLPVLLRVCISDQTYYLFVHGSSFYLDCSLIPFPLSRLYYLISRAVCVLLVVYRVHPVTPPLSLPLLLFQALGLLPLAYIIAFICLCMYVCAALFLSLGSTLCLSVSICLCLCLSLSVHISIAGTSQFLALYSVSLVPALSATISHSLASPCHRHCLTLWLYFHLCL